MLVHLDGGVLVLDRVEVGVGADGRRRRDHADAPIAGRQRRGHRARPHDAEDRQVVAAAEVTEGDGRRGVAGDDDRLDVAGDELVEGLDREVPDLVVGTDAVRRPEVVAEIDRRFARGAAEDLAEDGQAAHARVEDPDRPRVHCGRPASADRPPLPDGRSRPRRGGRLPPCGGPG